MQSEVESIAKGLSEAQRAAIRGARSRGPDHGGYAFMVVDYVGLWEHPVAEFLTLWTDRLTPLGLAVREYLLNNPDA